MDDKTETMIKRKHKEFNEKIKETLAELQGKQNGQAFSPAIEQLRKTAQMTKPTLPIGMS